MALDLEKDWDLLKMLGDTAREADTSHWNALLTYNGLLLASIAILAASGNVEKILVLIFAFCSVVSSALLILNFHSTSISSQESLGNAISKAPSQEEFVQRLNRKRKGSGRRANRTAFAQALIAGETVTLLLIIYSIQ